MNVAFYSEPVNTFIPFYCEQLKNYNNNTFCSYINNNNNNNNNNNSKFI